MASIASLKGVRTRYRNTLDGVTTSARDIIDSDLADRDKERCIQDSKKCLKLMKLYTTKLEEHMVKITEEIGDTDKEFAETVVDADSELIFLAEQTSIELELFIENIEHQEVDEKGDFKVKSEMSDMKGVLEMQQHMQKMLLAQMDKQKDYFEKREKKEMESSTVKLPKLDMVGFNGDKLNWITFWETFVCTIHDNKKLSNIEKFSYLLSKLYGEAKRAVDGLALTNENYVIAIDILQERFGQKQEVVDLHYQKLINIPAPTGKVDSLRSFLDSVERHIRSLEVLKENVNQHIFISMIRSKLPEFVLRQLEFHNGSKKEWTVYSLREQLREYITACEKAEKKEVRDNTDLPPQNKWNGSKAKNKQSGKADNSTSKVRQSEESETKISSAEALAANDKVKLSMKNKCRYCGAQHWSDECTKFKTVVERKKQLRGSCYKCLKEGHGAKDCKSQKSCIHCGDFNNHHRSLCPKKFGAKLSASHFSGEVGNASVSMESESASTVLSENTNSHALVSSNEMVLMQTAKTHVCNPDSSDRKSVRILFDSGSQRTYITEKLANELHLKANSEQELKLVTFGSDKPKVIKTKETQVCLTLKDGSVMKVSANVVPTISGQTQRNPVKHLLSEQVKHVINSVDLADNIPGVKESSTIDVLIGNDYYMELILPQRIELDPGLYLLSSKLGWILTGRVSDMCVPSNETSMFVMTYGSDMTKESSFVSVDPVIPTKPNLEDFWNIESIGIMDKHTKTSDEIALQKFQETLTFADGRYQVTWPWKDEEFELPENRTLALGRLRSTIARLSKNEKLMEKYHAVINDQLDKGVIEVVDRYTADGIKHYIPHHAVITPQKTTTKLRVVYDASAKAREGNMSLNDCLYRGPVILQDLCGMLIRLRLYNVAIVADIEKAFLQVGLQKDQRDVTRFLWLKDITKPVSVENIQEYRFTRVPFGVISSPFLLSATVQSHLDSCKSEITEKVKNDIYVDNVITGAESDANAIKFYESAKSVFKEASMNLREWVTNSKIVNTYIPEFDRAKEESLSVLGLNWNSREDIISLKSTDTISETSAKATKRIVLKEVAANFDPLGLYSPVLLNGKLLIQSLWAKNLDWDDEVTSVDQVEWDKIRADLKTICEHTLPRCVSVKKCSGGTKYSLCCFCDASEKAYAAAVYLKVSDKEITNVNLIFSKSRLAPMKGMTIPKLEIMAVLIGVRCVKFVEKELRVKIEEIHVFTDSQCCLHWINSEKDLPVFIKNRVKEIKQQKSVKFSYVKSVENPADIASRGTTVTKLVCSELWWYGPKWLSLPASKWPECTKEFLEKESVYSVGETVKGATDNAKAKMQSEQVNSAPFDIDIQKYSSVSKLFRITAYVLRFLRSIRKCVPVKQRTLTSAELNEAEMLWLKHVQHKHYVDVIKSVQANKANNTIRQLNLFKDESGILRCRGRLQNAVLTEGSRFPILLPKKDRLTELVVEKHHKELLHSGESQTLSHIRYKYWIPQGRATVKSVLRQCRVCRKFEGGPYPFPQMPPLPNARVTESPPFSHTGLDYLGPLYVKIPYENVKVWVCLFTCLVTRAIHLELVLEMTAKEFLLAFRRFISQRGVPSEIISDNALQFKTANRTLDLVWKNVCVDKDVQSFVSEKRIHWNFIVELAPWMGGFYERLVGVVKRSMRKAIGRKMMTLIQMQTFLKECEAVVNSRPLVYVGEDINSSVSLTPGHFLTINPRVAAPDIDQDEKDVTYMPSQSTADNLLQMWHKGQKLLNAFWRVCVNEYLLSLRERSQSKIKTGRIEAKITPSVGDIVHVKEDLPRSCWKLGRIQNVRHSRDKAVRSAEVRLSSGRVIKRPLNLLYPLEVTENTNDYKEPETSESRKQRPERKAAEVARKKNSEQLS